PRPRRIPSSPPLSAVQAPVWRGLAMGVGRRDGGRRQGRAGLLTQGPAARPLVFAEFRRAGCGHDAYFWRSSFLSSLPTLVLSSAVSVRTRLGTAHFETTPLSAYRWT